MANNVLLYPNYVDADARFATVAFSGGWWLPSLPLTNLADPLLVNIAQSVNCTLAATQFWVDLGQPRDVRGIAVPFIVGSRDATMRWRGFAAQDSDGTVLGDTDWKDMHPVTYPAGTLPFEHPSFLDGRATEEEADIYPAPFVHVFDEAVIARYWLCEIDDTTSTLGSVGVPRVVLAPGWQPPLNPIYGAGMQWEDPTIVETSLGGAEFFEVLEGRRVFRFGFDYLPDDQALTYAFDMQKRLGIHGQLFYVFDPDDTVHLGRRSMLCRMRALSPIQYAIYRRMSATYELSEVIA